MGPAEGTVITVDRPFWLFVGAVVYARGRLAVVTILKRFPGDTVDPVSIRVRFQDKARSHEYRLDELSQAEIVESAIERSDSLDDAAWILRQGRQVEVSNAKTFDLLRTLQAGTANGYQVEVSINKINKGRSVLWKYIPE